MDIGIDASSIRGVGGGVTHLAELLCSARPQEHRFKKIVVWGSSSTLASLEDRPWLFKKHQRLLDYSLPSIIFWQQVMLDRLVARESCDVLFVPGGSYRGSFRPFVTMSRNMLPFEWPEARRYGISWWTLKFILLRQLQLATFKRANGLIFLTDFARQAVSKFLGSSTPRITVVPHGVDGRFRLVPKLQQPLSSYNYEAPLRLLYVSPIAPYKHQWHVMDAIWQLRQSGLPVVLNLVGPIRNCRRRFFNALDRFDPKREWIQYHGEIPFAELHHVYRQADVFIFASSCENLPNIILEAMSAGLPIASSNRGPMPEVLGEAGVYFDPENPLEIALAVQSLLEDPNLRRQKASASFERAKKFTWERCASETFDFIKSCLD